MIFWGVNSDPVQVASLADVLAHLSQVKWFGSVQVAAPQCLKMYRQPETPPISVGDVWYTPFSGEDPDPTSYYMRYKIVQIRGKKKVDVTLQEAATITRSFGEDTNWGPRLVKGMYQLGSIKLPGRRGEYLRPRLGVEESIVCG